MLNNLVRKIRILLQLDQLAILRCTSDDIEVFFCKKGRNRKNIFPFDEIIGSMDIFEKISNSCIEKNTFGKKLIHKLSGAKPNYILFLKEINEDGLIILCGGAERPIRYAHKILGKHFLIVFNSSLKQSLLSRQTDFQQATITNCINIGQMLLENKDMDRFFNEINDKVKAITGAQNAGLFLYNEKQQKLVLQEPTFDIPRNNAMEVGFYSASLSENSMLINVFKNHKACYKNEITQDPFIMGSLGSFLKVNNVLVVPLLRENACTGVYFLINRPGGFRQDEIKMIQELMSQIAVLVEVAEQLKQQQIREVDMRNIYQQEKENSSKYKFLMEFHQKLTQTLIQEPGLEGIINKIAQHLKMPVVFFDYLHWKRILSSIGKAKSELFRLEDLVDYFNRLSKSPELYLSMKPYRESYYKDNVINTVVIAAIRVNNNLIGFLVVFEDAKKLSQLEMLAVERAVYMCTLEFMKQKMAFDIQQEIKGDFLEALLYWDDSKEKDVLKMAVNYGYDLSSPYLVVVMCCNNDRTEEKNNRSEKLDFVERSRNSHVINNILKKTLHEVLIFSKGDYIIILAPTPRQENLLMADNEAKNFISQIKRSVLNETNLSVSIGVGTVANSLKDIKNSYNEACTTVDYLQKAGKGGVMFFHEIGFYQLFSDQKEKKRLEDIAKKQLQEVIISDSSRGTSFLRTLERYYFHDGNLRATSEDLHIHINTLRYRLIVFKETFNIDLTEEKCKFNTYFAIKILLFLCPDLFNTKC